MNTTLTYIAVAASFAAAAFAFSAGATIAGVLAASSGILIGITLIRKEPKE